MVSGDPGPQCEIVSPGIRGNREQNGQICKWSHTYREGCTENTCLEQLLSIL